MAVPDAGFFLDHANVLGVKHYGTGMRAAFKLGNTSAVLNAECVRSKYMVQRRTAGGLTTVVVGSRTSEEEDAAFDCVFPQHFAQYIKTSMHVTQSQYDSFQLSDILMLPCKPSEPAACNTTMMAAFQQYVWFRVLCLCLRFPLSAHVVLCSSKIVRSSHKTRLRGFVL